MEAIINFARPRGFVKCYPRWTFSALEKCKACPGKKRFLNDTFYFERTKENDEYFRSNTFNGWVRIDEEPISLENDFLSAARPKFQFNTKPDSAQMEALSLAAKNPLHFAFFEKPGFGKSKVIIDHLFSLWCQGLIDCAVISAPNIVHEQWAKDEIPKHTHFSLPYKVGVYRSGKKFDNSITFPDAGVFRILTINHEATITDKGADAIDNMTNSGKCAMVIDESHIMKNPTGKVSINFFKKRNDFAAKFLATGTPDPLGLQDYFGQMRFLNPRMLGVSSFVGFKSRYCVMGGFEKKVIKGYVNSDLLHKLMAPYVHVGAPIIDGEQIFEQRKFDMLPEQRKIYDQMATDMLVLFENGQMATVSNQLAAMMRLQQITCGRLPMDDGTISLIPTARPALLKSLLDTYSSEKVVIWNRFRADMSAQLEMLGDKAVGYWGEHDKDQRVDAIQKFLDKNSSVQYFIASPQAAGTGLNLQGSSWINIYYSNSDNFGVRKQSEYRTYRRGVNYNVLYIDMIARRSVDVAITSRNTNKRNNSLLSYNEFKSIIEGESDE